MQQESNPFNPVYLEPGKVYRIIAGFSEAAMHLNIAGRPTNIRVEESQRMVQLLDESAQREISSPILNGEAGLYEDRSKKQSSILNYVHEKDFLGDITSIIAQVKKGNEVKVSEALYNSFLHDPPASASEKGFVMKDSIPVKDAPMHLTFTKENDSYKVKLLPFEMAKDLVQGQDSRKVAHLIGDIFSFNKEQYKDKAREDLPVLTIQGGGKTMNK